jgi:signal-transduction protein with cAMP-binding, CBS, and nucleotidyltransferase domain
MTPELLSSMPNDATSVIFEKPEDELLEREVAEFMTPGCVVISDAASVADASKAVLAHHVDAVLVVGARTGLPLGWVTAAGLMRWVDGDREQSPARAAITEPVRAIAPTECVRVALYALSLSRSGRLLVRSKPDQTPEGVLTEFDLASAARR